MAGIAAYVYIYFFLKQPGKITLQEPTKNVGTAETEWSKTSLASNFYVKGHKWHVL